jgi:hypothetical protein
MQDLSPEDRKLLQTMMSRDVDTSKFTVEQKVIFDKTRELFNMVSGRVQAIMSVAVLNTAFGNTLAEQDETDTPKLSEEMLQKYKNFLEQTANLLLLRETALILGLPVSYVDEVMPVMLKERLMAKPKG